jgi:two-component system response regulator MprA
MPDVTVLVVDDDSKTADMLRRTLMYDGCRALVATNGVDALSLSRNHRPSLIVLDWNMPVMDGLAVVQRMRMEDRTPVLMLTGRSSIDDKVRALSDGADDYLVKPFAPEEFLARVHALLRRTSELSNGQPLTFAGLDVDPRIREVRRDGRAIALSPRECDLLCAFMRRPGQVLRREQLLRDVWGYDFGGEDGVLDVYVGYLRAKLESAGEPRVIHTVRRVGYVLKDPA